MNLDDKALYESEQKKLLKMSVPQLEKLLEELYEERFNKHNIELDVYYRLVSQVRNIKTRTGKSLIFHMQKFLGAVVSLIISYYIHYIHR